MTKLLFTKRDDDTNMKGQTYFRGSTGEPQQSAVKTAVTKRVGRAIGKLPEVKRKKALSMMAAGSVHSFMAGVTRRIQMRSNTKKTGPQ